MNSALSELKARKPSQAAEAPPQPSLPARRVLVSWLLVLMLWGGYNTDYGRAFEPGFPTGALDLLHGLRALLPLLAGFLAAVKLLSRRPLVQWPLRGPLGLLALYTLLGVISSILLSADSALALWWAGQYASVLLVMWAILSDTDPVLRASRVLELNWMIVAALSAGFLAAIVFSPGVEIAPHGLLRVGHYGGYESEDQIFGMSTSRSTGIGRYAAIAAIAGFGRLWRGRKQFRIFWVLLFLASLAGIVYLQARTALLSLLAGVFGLLWLRRGPKLFLVLATIAGLVLFAATGSYQAFWDWLTQGQPFDATLTGRTVVWAKGWELFMKSPILGFGFQADRVFLEVHMHDVLFQALVQSGLLGAVALMAALVHAWVLLLRHYRLRPAPGTLCLPAEIPGVIAFFTIASIAESTFALFGIAWLLLAPCLAYLQSLEHARRAVVRSEVFGWVPAPAPCPAGLPARSTLAARTPDVPFRRR